MAGLGERQTIRLLKALGADGLIASSPGRKGSSTRYVLNFDAIRALPTVRGRERLAADAADIVSPVTPGSVVEDTPTVSSVAHESGIEPVSNREEASRKRAASRALASQKKKTQALTYSEWDAAREAEGEMLLPDSDPIFDYCANVGITRDMLEAHLPHFKMIYVHGSRATKKVADWRGFLRESVIRNWYRLWEERSDGRGLQWTNVGRTAQAAAQQAAQREKPQNEPQSSAPPEQPGASDPGKPVGMPESLWRLAKSRQPEQGPAHA